MKSNLKNFDLKNKRVFLRADLNVPLKNSTIIDDYKLKSILPTINLIQKKGGKVILATHIGRPNNKEKELSTKNLINWFENQEYKVDFEVNLEKAKEKSKQNVDTILLLENLRFFPGEKERDQKFADKLFLLADLYVNDAFGVSHRNDTSVTLLPEMYEKNKRTIGPLIESEINYLNRIRTNPEQPFLLIIGGAKVKDKLVMVDKLLEKIKILALLPATVFTFLKANGIEVGKSLVEKDLFEFAISLKDKIKKKNINLILPKDYLVAKDSNENLFIINEDQFKKDYYGISIGPKTIKILHEEIINAKTIFLSGLSGFVEKEETLEPIKKIFQSITESSALTIVAGGDSVAAANILGFANDINHLSTGGGSALVFLSGNKLPGLEWAID